MARPNWKSDVRTEREAHYASLLDEQEGSGLSVAAFAEDAGLSVATLYSWRRRLGRATPRDNGVALLEVRVDDEGEALEVPGRMTVEVADGTRIELEADFDESALERLLGVLDRC
jgi:transposase-like protein